jgi:hypothetical protein
MSDPHFTALEPVSLVMRRMECMYCFAPDTDTILIESLFGLKVCDSHKAAGVRDCKAYLHKKKLVRLRDAFKHPVVGRFLTAVKEMGTFNVERSDLTIQPGWTLRKENVWAPAFLQGADDRWRIPVTVGVYPDIIDKNVPIIGFMNPDICPDSTPEFRTLIEETIDCLREGIYSKEFEEFELAMSQDRVGSVTELQGVAQVLYEGSAVRIYFPHGEPAVAQPADPVSVPD